MSPYADNTYTHTEFMAYNAVTHANERMEALTRYWERFPLTPHPRMNGKALLLGTVYWEDERTKALKAHLQRKRLQQIIDTYYDETKTP